MRTRIFTGFLIFQEICSRIACILRQPLSYDGHTSSSVNKIILLFTISIHAPARGGDVVLTLADVLTTGISIHAPREGGRRL